MQLQLSRGDRLSLKEKPKKNKTNTFTGFDSIPTINLIKSKKLKIDFFKRFLSYRFQVSKMDFFGTDRIIDISRFKVLDVL